MNKIVILDEATSSLTHSMETRISRALSEHFRSSTVITITHRVRYDVKIRKKLNSVQLKAVPSIDQSCIGFRRFPQVHRALDMDKVLVLEAGQVKEFDSPARLAGDRSFIHHHMQPHMTFLIGDFNWEPIFHRCLVLKFKKFKSG